MKTKLSKKRAISTVLTTVIILVSSVVLGSGVVLYGTSLFQGGTQTENITVSGTKVWVHTTAPEGLAWGASGIRNTGDKVVAVDKIQIRGVDIPFAQWYADSEVASNVFQQALNHTGWSGVAGELAEVEHMVVQEQLQSTLIQIQQEQLLNAYKLTLQQVLYH
jgi:hypothetical protein